MKEDRLITAVGVLGAFLAVLMMSVGKFIMGGITLLIVFALFYNRGSGKFNKRSIYEKIVKTDVTIEELFERIRDVDTPLGRAWMAEHRGFPGKSIVFGPGSFKDCVVISRKKNYIDIKHITLLDNIIRGEEDEYRFKDLISASEVEVTPERYSVFAGFKLASVMLINELYELTEALSEDRNAAVPESLGLFRFYYHNSTEGFFKDADGNEILKVDSAYQPFCARVLDADGNEMASVMPHAFNAKGVVNDGAGYEMFANGEHYGEMERFKDDSGEGFIARTDDGEFRITIFPACLRANISCNYTIEHDGRHLATIGGSPNILFDTVGRCQNDVILSYDDDYLVLYAIIEVFIITLNRKFLK